MNYAYQSVPRIGRFPPFDVLESPIEAHSRRGVARASIRAIETGMHALVQFLVNCTAFRESPRKPLRFVRYEFQEARPGGVEDFSIEPALLLDVLARNVIRPLG